MLRFPAPRHSPYVNRIMHTAHGSFHQTVTHEKAYFIAVGNRSAQSSL